MAEGFDPRFETTQAPARARADIDAGLRSYMLQVYNYMASGVLVTGIMAMLVFTSPLVASMIYQITPDGYIAGYTTLGMITAFSPLAFVMIISFGINRLSVTATQALFWTFAAIMGLSLSSIMFIYTGTSVARIFFITAAMFASLSLWGYTTKKDLTGWGSFLFMGLIGIIIASVVNIFMASTAMMYAISIIGVLIFAGLTAYDTQKIKEMYYEGDGHETTTKKAVMGALRLYLDFINMFLMMLRLFGNRN